jgi:hypothetical protein
MRNRVVVALVALLLVGGIAATRVARAADDVLNGTWKLNLAKSKFDPGPAPKSMTVIISVANGTETYKAEGVDATGKATAASFTAKFGGPEAPTTGIPYADTIQIKRLTPNHLTATHKKGGKVVMTVDVVVAADGMSRTLTYSGTNEKGAAVHDVVVFDKQMAGM